MIMNYRRKITLFFTVCLCVLLCKEPVLAQDYFQATVECGESQGVVIETTLLEGMELTGIDIYRADTLGGEYQYIGSVTTEESSSNWYYDWYYDYETEDWYYDYERVLTYTDLTAVNVYQTYYYRIDGYQIIDEVKTVVQSAEVSVYIRPAAPQITLGERSGKKGAKIQWTQDVNADGYIIYYVKDFDEASYPISVDVYNEASYTVAETITGNYTLEKKFSKLMHGVTYTYRVASYKIINGVPVESMKSAPVSVAMDYYTYSGESYDQRIKRAFGSEKKKEKNFKTQKKASKQMKTIKIKVWDFKNGKKGKKVTRTKYLTVNKRLAPSIKAMFDEIYKCSEKQVIKDIGCYSYRSGEHMYGMAIDINPNENYMVNGKKKLAGSFWNPKKSKYSIPLDCETVRIMYRYGFYRGFWGDRKDYMHFSYFGT